MSNIIRVDFTPKNLQNIPYCPSIRPKSLKLRKKHKVSKSPIFIFQMFEAFIDGIVNIFSEVKEAVCDFNFQNIYFWQSLSTSQKIFLYEKNIQSAEDMPICKRRNI